MVDRLRASWNNSEGDSPGYFHGKAGSIWPAISSREPTPPDDPRISESGEKVKRWGKETGAYLCEAIALSLGALASLHHAPRSSVEHTCRTCEHAVIDPAGPAADAGGVASGD